MKITRPGISYVYDYAGNTDNIVKETRTSGSYAGETTYAYDTLGQLTRVNDPVENATWVYTYDRGGNILNKKRYAYTTGTVGTVQQTITYTYDGTWKDKLATYNGITLTHDAGGNLTNDGSWTYGWQAGRELLNMTHTNGTYVHYDYDHNGMRVRKTVAGVATNYTVSGKRVTHLIRGNDWMHFFYDGQGRPAIVNYNNATYHYLYNLQGDVIGLIDTSGSVVVEYKYDAWGKIIARTGSLVDSLGWLNPFRYRGYVYDEETGLYYLRSRYYNPEWGRFVNADVLLGKQGALLSHNLFAYCQNNAVMFSDYTGQKRAPFTVATVEPVSPQNDALTVMLSPSAINITVYVDVYGDVEGEFVVSAIEKYWNGEFAIDGQNMTLTCDAILGKSPNGFAIAYETSNAPGTTHAACTLEGIAWKSGYSKVYLHRAYNDGRVKSDELLQWSVGHEFGHVLGVADYYTVYPGSDFDSIMNKVWDQVTASDVQMLIRATQTQEWTMWQ